MNAALFSSAKDNWRTPPELFDKLNAEYGFMLDACADEENHLTPRYYTRENSCLDKTWGERVFINPPYGRQIGAFVKKAYEQRNAAEVIVLLLPARTDTAWFHEYLYGKAEISFIRGRLRFHDEHGAKDAAPFPSMLAVFRR